MRCKYKKNSKFTTSALLLRSWTWTPTQNWYSLGWKMCRNALFQGCVSAHYSFNLLVYSVQKWSLAQQQSRGIYCKMSSCVCVWPFLDIRIFFSLICKRHRNRCDYGHSLNKDYPLLLNYSVCFLMFIFFFPDVRYNSCTWDFRGTPWKTSLTE